jgi:hypothetical protein
MGDRNACFLKNRHLEYQEDWEDNIEMDNREIGCEEQRCIELA